MATSKAAALQGVMTLRNDVQSDTSGLPISTHSGEVIDGCPGSSGQENTPMKRASPSRSRGLRKFMSRSFSGPLQCAVAPDEV